MKVKERVRYSVSDKDRGYARYLGSMERRVGLMGREEEGMEKVRDGKGIY